MEKGFDRLRGVAAASAMGLGLLGAGSGRAATVAIPLGTTRNLAATLGPTFSSATLRMVVNGIRNSGGAFVIIDLTVLASTAFSFLTTSGTSFTFTSVAYSDAFDGVFRTTVGGNVFSNPDSNVDLTGNVLTTDTVVDIVAGLDAQLEFAFDASRGGSSVGLIRAMYTFTNTTGAQIMTTVNIGGNLGSDTNTTVQDSESGDLFADNADLWTVTSAIVDGGDPPPIQDPVLVITRYGGGAAVIPTETTDISTGLYDNDYDLTVPANSTQRLLLFIEAHMTNAGASAAAVDFETLEAANTAGLLTGISAVQRSEIVNYGADADLDGALDSVDAFPSDPDEDTDTDGDGIGDNADAFPNDATETVDTDGDGVGDNADAFPNDPTETLDTDGDGVGDNADAFPNDASRSEAASSSSSGATSLPALFALLGIPALLRRFRKDK